MDIGKRKGGNLNEANKQIKDNRNEKLSNSEDDVSGIAL